MQITRGWKKSQLQGSLGLFWGAVLDFVYPPHCLLCDAPLASAPGLCQGCRACLGTIEGPRCSRCGCPTDSRQRSCGNCADKRFRFSRLRTLAAFNPQMQRMIHLLKYQGKCLAGRVLGDALGRTLRADPMHAVIETVVPVPLHASRERERGFNQSAIIASAADAHLGLGVRGDILKRVRPTKTQTTLDLSQREANVSGAFRVRKPGLVEDRSLLLVDDVVTTGSTSNACTDVLLEAGAREVFVAAAACPYFDEGDCPGASDNRI